MTCPNKKIPVERERSDEEMTTTTMTVLATKWRHLKRLRDHTGGLGLWGRTVLGTEIWMILLFLDLKEGGDLYS